MQISSSIGSASNVRTRAPALLVALLFALVTVAGFSRTATAEKKIVVFKFTGKRPAKIQKAVVNMLKKEHTVVTQARYNRTAKKLRAKRRNNENVAKVLQKLEADGVVVGSVKKKRGRVYRVIIKLRSATDGSFVDEFEVLTRGLKLSPKARKVVRKKLLAAIDDLPVIEEAEPEEVYEEPAEPDEEEPLVAEADDDDDDDEEVAVEKEGDSGDSALTDEEKADLMVRGRGVDVAGGLSFIGRSLSFTVRDGLGDLAPRGYDGALVAGAYFTAEVYPLGLNLKKKGFLRNIGLTASVDKVIKIESRLAYRDADNNPAEIVLPSSQLRWSVGVVYRHNFGKKPTSPTVKLGVRYGGFSFTIDRSEADAAGVPVDIPDMEYTIIDPGLGIRFPLSAKLALLADLRYLLVTGTGDMQLDTQYGAATVTGFDGDIGFEYMLKKQIYLRAGGRYTKIGFDFSGGADLTNGRDGDDSTQDVFGANDQYFGGYVTAAYRF